MGTEGPDSSEWRSERREFADDHHADPARHDAHHQRRSRHDAERIFTSRGRVLTFGNAAHLGDVSDVTLAGPVLDSIVTPSGKGYYMVASDGGIFSFGDAEFLGSMGGRKLNAPVQSLVPDSDGVGYWLVASNGGIFDFSGTPDGFKGSLGSTPPARPITSVAVLAG